MNLPCVIPPPGFLFDVNKGVVVDSVGWYGESLKELFFGKHVQMSLCLKEDMFLLGSGKRTVFNWLSLAEAVPVYVIL